MNKRIRKDLHPILSLLRKELISLFGDQLERIYLYGSQARGDAKIDSDIDILIVLRSEFDYFDMIQRTSAVVGKLSLDNDVVISRAFTSKQRFLQEKNPWIKNIHREGIAI